MNLQENIRRILREDNDKKERTHYHKYNLGDVIDGSKLDDLSGGLVGNDNNQYVLVQYPLSKFPYTRQDLIDSDPEYEKEEIWRLESIKDNFDKTPPIPQEGDGLHRIIAAKELGYKTILMWKKITNLQESIRRILREGLYSPSGDEHIPSRFVAHKSNPVWRENIELTGLQISVGECYQQHVGGDVECKKSIFATDSSNKKDWFDSTYDDDIWLIDTECAGVTWYKDRHFDFSDHKYHIVTFEDISPDCLKLIYKGTGSGDVKTWPKDSPNLYESIQRILRDK